MKKALIIFSGGQDSTTCLLWAIEKGYEVTALTFAYAQRHSIEIACARFITEKFKVPHHVIDISFFGQLSKTSSLTNTGIGIDATNEIPNSFVPNRNQLFFTLAHSFAINNDMDTIVMGVCETDYSGYPDCRKEFLDKLSEVTNYGGNKTISLEYPLMGLNKAETFKLANSLGHLNTIINDTHTCYAGGREFHPWGYGCGTCPACELREKGYNEYIKSSSSQGEN